MFITVRVVWSMGLMMMIINFNVDFVGQFYLLFQDSGTVLCHHLKSNVKRVSWSKDNHSTIMNCDELNQVTPHKYSFDHDD